MRSIPASSGTRLYRNHTAHRRQLPILARTIEWGGSDLNSQYVIVPRGYAQQSYVPGGTTDGMPFRARYGYVGLAVEQKEFVAEAEREGTLCRAVLLPGLRSL